MPNVCKNCRFWSNEWSKDKAAGECNRVIIRWPTEKIDLAPKEFMVKVKVADDHGLNVTLYTHEDFGCNLHEV